MRQLCSESSCSHSGRSVLYAAQVAMGVELRPSAKVLEPPSNPKVAEAARSAATSSVTRQKSVDGIVAQRPS